MQYVVFELNNNELYGVDVKNLKAILIKEEVKIATIPKTNKWIVGMGTIRNEPLLIIDLEDWIPTSTSQEKRKHLVIMNVKLNNKVLGILAKNVIDIFEVNDEELSEVASNDKISNVMYINIDGKKKLVTILNYNLLTNNM